MWNCVKLLYTVWLYVPVSTLPSTAKFHLSPCPLPLWLASQREIIEKHTHSHWYIPYIVAVAVARRGKLSYARWMKPLVDFDRLGYDGVLSCAGDYQRFGWTFCLHIHDIVLSGRWLPFVQRKLLSPYSGRHRVVWIRDYQSFGWTFCLHLRGDGFTLQIVISVCEESDISVVRMIPCSLVGDYLSFVETFLHLQDVIW
jgi:hypothetical protein